MRVVCPNFCPCTYSPNLHSFLFLTFQQNHCDCGPFTSLETIKERAKHEMKRRYKTMQHNPYWCYKENALRLSTAGSLLLTFCHDFWSSVTLLHFSRMSLYSNPFCRLRRSNFINTILWIQYVRCKYEENLVLKTIIFIKNFFTNTHYAEVHYTNIDMREEIIVPILCTSETKFQIKHFSQNKNQSYIVLGKWIFSKTRFLWKSYIIVFSLLFWFCNH